MIEKYYAVTYSIGKSKRRTSSTWRFKYKSKAKKYLNKLKKTGFYKNIRIKKVSYDNRYFYDRRL